MGNNHDKYFGENKRKILVLGIQNSGKTCLVEAIVGQGAKVPTPTKDMNIRDVKIGDLLVTFFDLAGSQRQRVFWKQHYEGTQGVIFMVGVDNKQNGLKELEKVLKVKSLEDIPFGIGISKSDLVDELQIHKLTAEIQTLINSSKNKAQIFPITQQNKQSPKRLVKWILAQTKPL